MPKFQAETILTQKGEYRSGSQCFLKRNLVQLCNPGRYKPQPGDLVIFGGHVAIVSAVGRDVVEIIQQNPGPFGNGAIVPVAKPEYRNAIRQKRFYL